MPSTYIKLDPNKPRGRGALRVVDAVLDALDALRRERAVLEEIASGSDFAAVSLEYLPTGGTVLQAQAFYNILVAAVARMDHPDVKQLSRFDQD